MGTFDLYSILCNSINSIVGSHIIIITIIIYIYIKHSSKNAPILAHSS